MSEIPSTDIISRFPYGDPNCKGCGKPLSVENAWMTDGCPCNSELGINSMNETRWRLLMQLQQKNSRLTELYKSAAHESGKLFCWCVENLQKFPPSDVKWQEDVKQRLQRAEQLQLDNAALRDLAVRLAELAKECNEVAESASTRPMLDKLLVELSKTAEQLLQEAGAKP